jgi:adenine-specific DNA-methyltransferase
MNNLIKEGRIVFPSDTSKQPMLKRYKSALKSSINPVSTWINTLKSKDVSESVTSLETGLNSKGTKEIQEILDEKNFNYPKPTSLPFAFIRQCTDKNAIILDSFAGSGTTAHAVLALNQEDGGNRKFILIECEDYADTITAERVRRVIRGVPTAKDQALKNGLGGHFTYCTLGSEMDIENMLSGGHLPDYNALSQYVFYTATGHSLPHTITPRNDFFVGETDIYAVYVIYRDDLGYLRSNQSALNDEKVDIIQAHPSPKQKLVFATAKFMSGEDLRARNITFCQIPYAIHNFVGA